MERWNGRVALVTGASAGIGAELCRELVKHGLTVVGCAREVHRIQAIADEDAVKNAPGKLHAVKCDLCEESDILNLFEDIRSRYGRLDICINNAGFTTNSPLLTGETSDWKRILEVNVLALCVCTRESIKLMQENDIDDGQIIHISSIGGHRLPATNEMPGFNFYCGTKFMVRALTEGLRKELRAAKKRIRVASISPGVVETEFLARTLNPEIAQSFYGSGEFLKGKDIADAVVYILRSPPHVDVNDIIVQPVQQIF
nr:farnesol dehydrogenase [Pardosa pseudoannulata]